MLSFPFFPPPNILGVELHLFSVPYLHFLLLDRSFDVDFDVLDEAKVERVPGQVNEESYTA